jgi:hypothetical protein
VKVKIYLDIDGVLLTPDHKIPEYGEEFISYLTSHHEIFWLTTHCHGGVNGAIKYLSQFYSGITLANLKTVIQTDWKDLKTEAIDFNSEFIWLEDYPFESEKRVLEKYNRIDSLVVVNLKRKSELKDLMLRIGQLSENSSN